MCVCVCLSVCPFVCVSPAQLKRCRASLKRLEGPRKASLELIYNTVIDCTESLGHRSMSNSSVERFYIFNGNTNDAGALFYGRLFSLQ